MTQAQLISNAQALASRLTRGRYDKADSVQTNRNVSEDELLSRSHGVDHRKKRRMGSNSIPAAPDHSLGSLSCRDLADIACARNSAISFDQSIAYPRQTYVSSNKYEYATDLNSNGNFASTCSFSDADTLSSSHRSPQPPAQSRASMGPSESPMAIRLHEAPTISPAVSQLGSRTVSCNCKKSRCLKLYCDCFRAMKYCDGCNCQQCANAPEYENERQKSMMSITERNPEAFKPRITSDSPRKRTNGMLKDELSPAVVQYHFSGCHCKKSACLKKYCECYQAQIPCQAKCRCQDCKNTVADGIFTETGVKDFSLKSPGGMVDDSHIQYTTPNVPNSLVQGLVRAARVVEHRITPSDLYCRQPLVHRQDNLIVRESHLSDKRAEASERMPNGLIPNPSTSFCSTSDSSAMGNISNISVDVLTAVLAAKLRSAGSLGGSGASPEECIREGLLLMQQQGIILSRQQNHKDQDSSAESAAIGRCV